MRCHRLAPALLVVAALACDALPGRPDPAHKPARPSAVTDPVALYDQNCAGCHGDDRRPGASVKLADPLYLALADDAWLVRVTAQGLPRTAMPAFSERAGGHLTDAQVGLLVTGMRTRWGKPDALGGAAAPALGAPPGDPAAGAAAYETFCAHCHGADGTGGPHGGSVVDGAYLRLTSNQLLRTIVLVGRPALGMPDWRSLVPGRAMSDAEIADVVAWLAARRPTDAGKPDPTEAWADG